MRAGVRVCECVSACVSELRQGSSGEMDLRDNTSSTSETLEPCRHKQQGSSQPALLQRAPHAFLHPLLEPYGLSVPSPITPYIRLLVWWNSPYFAVRCYFVSGHLWQKRFFYLMYKVE